MGLGDEDADAVQASANHRQSTTIERRGACGFRAVLFGAPAGVSFAGSAIGATVLQDDIRAIFAATAEAQRRFVARHADALARVIDVTVDALRERSHAVLLRQRRQRRRRQHLAAEFTNRYLLDRAPLPAIALDHGQLGADQHRQRLRLRAGVQQAGPKRSPAAATSPSRSRPAATRQRPARRRRVPRPRRRHRRHLRRQRRRAGDTRRSPPLCVDATRR